MLGIWSENDFAYEGSTFTARGQTANPKPDPHPPIWIGGNSRQSRRRVARYGNGWNPFPAPRVLSQTTKTPPLETVDDLSVMLDELWQYVEEAGRDRSEIDVSFGTGAGGRPRERRLQRRRPAGRPGRAGEARGHLVGGRDAGRLTRSRRRGARALRGVGDPRSVTLAPDRGVTAPAVPCGCGAPSCSGTVPEKPAEPVWVTASSPYCMDRRRFVTTETNATIRMTAARLKIRT